MSNTTLPPAALAMPIAALQAARTRSGCDRCVPLISTAPAERDEGLVDVARRQRHVGAVLAVEDQRERLAVADAEDHQRGQPLGIGHARRATSTPSRASCSRMKRPM